MKLSHRNSVRCFVNIAAAKAARPTSVITNPDTVFPSVKKSSRLLSLLILLPLMSSCSEKATYIRGEQGSSGQISINPLTGAASVIITGPYEYCALPKKWNGPNICAETPTEKKKELQ